MSASLWRDLDGPAHVRRLVSEPWRVVEAQHVVSTRKLVDSDEEQRLLEELLERSKPALPADARHLHYLLATPFRYPPLRGGTRFGTRLERGIWYGAEELRTAFAEVAYYRLLFLEGTKARIDRLSVDLTAFRASVRARLGVDLTRAPFSAHTPRISSKTSYAVSQRLGRDMREAGVQAFRFVSARDPKSGPNLALFDPGSFASPKPRALETWHAVAERAAVEVSRRDFFRRASFRFARAEFLVRGALPMPGA